MPVRIALPAGMAGAILLGAAGCFSWLELRDGSSSAHALLVAYLWGLTVTLGALFWLALQRLVGARWSVPLLVWAELLAAPMPLWIALGLALLASVARESTVLYPWVAQHRSESWPASGLAYLSPYAFLIRGLLYLALWLLLAWGSRARLETREQYIEQPPAARLPAAAALILWVLSVSLAAIDWVMTLYSGWHSSLFPVYFAAGCAVAGAAALAVISQLAAGRAGPGAVLTTRRSHDLARTINAFMLVWAYLAFCQFLLIWYVNLPDEVGWYRQRLGGGWRGVSLGLGLAHWLIPFAGLLSTRVRQQPRLVAAWGAWLLGAHYLDIYWLVMPEFEPAGPSWHLVDLVCWVGVLGLMVACMAIRWQRTLVLAPTLWSRQSDQ